MIPLFEEYYTAAGLCAIVEVAIERKLEPTAAMTLGHALSTVDGFKGASNIAWKTADEMLVFAMNTWLEAHALPALVELAGHEETIQRFQIESDRYPSIDDLINEAIKITQHMGIFVDHSDTFHSANYRLARLQGILLSLRDRLQL